MPVLRAGLGMVEGFLRLLPDARVGHVGIYRDEEDHVPVDYYERLPRGLPEARVYVLDPMLATGGSAVHALNKLKRAGARQPELVCLVAAPEGIEAVQHRAPGCPDLDGRGRPRARRERLHPPGTGRRRRPRVRHGLIGVRPVDPLVGQPVPVSRQAIE